MVENDEILKAAARLGFVDESGLAACRDLMAKGASPEDALARLAELTGDQLRGVRVLARHDHARADDEELAAFLLREGAVPKATLEACLEEQKIPYARGEPMPRLQDLLVAHGHATAQQLQMLLAARAQVEATRHRLKTAITSSIGAPVRVRPTTRSLPPPPGPSERDRRAPAEPFSAAFTFARRTSHIKAGRAELMVATLDVCGILDEPAADHLGTYLAGLIDDGATHIALNCEKLDAISNAGIAELVSAATRCREAQGDLRLCCLSEKVQKVVELTTVAAPLRVYENERGVVMSFIYM